MTTTSTTPELLAFLPTSHGQQLRRFWLMLAGDAVQVPLPRMAFVKLLEENPGAMWEWDTYHYPRMGWMLSVTRGEKAEGWDSVYHRKPVGE